MNSVSKIQQFLVLILGLSVSIFNEKANAQTFMSNPIKGEFSSFGATASYTKSTCVSGNAHGENGVTCGYFTNTTNFGTYHDEVFNIMRTSSGSNDIFVLNPHPDSGLNWIQTLGGPGDDQALSVFRSWSDWEDLVVVGYFSETVDFNPDPLIVENRTSLGGRDVFILCLSSTGGFKWVYTMGGPGDDSAASVEMASEDVYVTGSFIETLQYMQGGVNNTLLSNGGRDAFVARLDLATGDVYFVEGMGGPYEDVGRNIDARTNGVYITGEFIGIADLDPGAGVFSLESDAGDLSKKAIFVERIDEWGNLSWAKSIVPSGSYSRGAAVGSDLVGGGATEIYLVGDVAGLTDVDPGSGTYYISPIPSTGTVGFVLKLDGVTGNFMWAKTVNSTLGQMMTDVYVAWDSYAYISAIFNSNISLETGPGFYETYTTPAVGSVLAVYDHLGNLNNGRSINNVYAYSLCSWGHPCYSGDHGWMEFAGSYSTTTNFTDYTPDPQYSTAIGYEDAFTATWHGDCGGALAPIGDPGSVKSLVNSIAPGSLMVHPNPSNGKITLSLGGDALNHAVQITDAIGRVVYEAILSGNQEHSIDLSVQEPGVYLVNIKDGNSMLLEKIIIQ